MSAGIKRMLAERAARQRSLSGHSRKFNDDIARIRENAATLDEGFNRATKWKPSEALLIAYCVLATSARPEGADELLRERLAE